MNSHRQLVLELVAGCSFGRVGGELQELQTQSLVRLYYAAFWRPEHFECSHPEQRIAHLTTCNIASTHRTWILCSRGQGSGCTSPESRMRCHDREESEGRLRLWWVMSQLSRCKQTRVRKTVEETVWRDVLTTICRSEDLTVLPLVGCCRWNLETL